MPTETRRFLDPEQRTGLTTLYAKLFGSVTSPHSTGTIAAAEIGNGYYDFAGLDTTLHYTIQEEFTPSTRSALDPVLTTLIATLLVPTANAISIQIANDQLEGENGWDDGPIVVIAANAATAATQATAAATEIGKVPRAATAMAGGDDFALNAVTDTVNKLTVNYTKEEV